VPVDASAYIVNNYGTQYTVTLNNLEANPTSFGQTLSGAEVTFQNVVVPFVPYYSGDELVTVAAGGTTTQSGSYVGYYLAPWTMTSKHSFHTVVLSTNTAADTIIGPPGSDGVYSNANPSIAGNKADNPFATSLSWSFELIANNADPGPITGVSFQFGDKGPAIPGVDPPSGNDTVAAPEPSTWAMMLLGFAGVGFTAFRRSRKVIVPA
jgi:hypothetical protein